MLGQARVADQLDGAEPFQIAALPPVPAIGAITVVQMPLAQIGSGHGEHSSSGDVEFVERFSLSDEQSRLDFELALFLAIGRPGR
jgi:hypothetical protein